ncbi:MAG: hypothetical protein WBO45_15160, partial [Planctomycetota bacterium]
ARAGQPLPPAPPGVDLQAMALRPPPGVARVAADNRHLAVELALTAAARATRLSAVVHVGVGARGSPNVCWLAERLGVRCFAIARAEEVVCHRGDLMFADGSPCREFTDVERCRRCCTTSWWSRPPADAFRNRGDLLAASLMATETVFVRDANDRERLVAFGLAANAITLGQEPGAIAARLLG